MNKELNNLDSFILNRVEDSQFDFKEAYWEKMEILLDDEKNKRRPFFWRKMGIILALLFVGIAGFLFSKMNTTKKDKPQNLVTVKAAVKDESVTTMLTETAKENTQTAPTNTSNKNDITIINPTNYSSAKNATPEIAPNKATISDNNNDDNNLPKASNNNDVNTAKNNIQLIKNISQKGNSKVATQINNNQNEALPIQTNISNNVLNNNIEKQSITIIQGKPMVATDTVVYKKKNADDYIQYNPRYHANLKNYISEKYDSAIIYSFKPIIENGDNVKIDIKQLDTKKEKEPFEKKPFNFFATAGISINKAFENSILLNAKKWGFAPYMGVGIEKQISHKITLASQVGFTFFNGLNTQKSVSGNTYSFGLDSASYSIYQQKMFQTYLPISVYYQVIKNHFLSASIGAMYSFQTTSKYEEVKGKSQGFNTANRSFATTTKNNQVGYKDGINAFDLFLQAGYNYQVFSNLMLQVSIQQGLLDVTKNSFFNNTTQHTQTRFNLGIKYTFKRNNN